MHESEIGTFETCRLRRAMSEFEGEAENICSYLSSSQFDAKRSFVSAWQGACFGTTADVWIYDGLSGRNAVTG